MTENTKEVVAHVFRHEYGKIIAFLLHKYGTIHLEKIEDAVQEALLKAMQVWGYKGVPDNPTAWLLTVARNQLIDGFRKDNKQVLGKQDEVLNINKSSSQEELVLDNKIKDSQLGLIFACCHPSLSVEYQIILSLKLIGGFSNKEIARALFKKEETIAKSYTRAKKRLKPYLEKAFSTIEIGLRSRLEVVLKIVYLLFSEGYMATSGVVLIKKDICFEAIRLALLLSENKYCNKPEVHALIGLMCFHTARFDARISSENVLVDLEHQDRNLYNAELINLGNYHMSLAEATEDPTVYHIQAAISYYHCVAETFKDTNWSVILDLYTELLRQQYSASVILNRIIPFAKTYGAKQGLEELDKFAPHIDFSKNSLYYAIKATLHLELKAIDDAKEALDLAVLFSKNVLEQNHLKKKLSVL